MKNEFQKKIRTRSDRQLLFGDLDGQITTTVLTRQQPDTLVPRLAFIEDGGMDTQATTHLAERLELEFQTVPPFSSQAHGYPHLSAPEGTAAGPERDPYLSRLREIPSTDAHVWPCP